VSAVFDSKRRHFVDDKSTSRQRSTSFRNGFVYSELECDQVTYPVGTYKRIVTRNYESDVRVYSRVTLLLYYLTPHPSTTLTLDRSTANKPHNVCVFSTYVCGCNDTVGMLTIAKIDSSAPSVNKPIYIFYLR